MADESVAHTLERMDELDFAGWNGADWEGVFTVTTLMTFS